MLSVVKNELIANWSF
jgi:hypothetical protein